MNHCPEDDHIFLHALAQQYAFQLPLLARLYKKKPDPRGLWELTEKELLRLTSRLSHKTIHELQKRKQNISLPNCQKELADLAATGIQLICVQDAVYSDALRLIHEPPVLLYARGDVKLLQRDAALTIAVIGSRRVSDYGKYVVADIGRTLKFFDCTIVSGLAIGVDAHAHETALANDIPTIAVLGSPVTDEGITPPRNKPLAARVLEGGGLIVSEYAPGTPCRPEFFPERNRIIAGLSALTIVVEAAEKSGSLITARLATEEYRDVFAVPGQIYAPQSAGTNQLIELGTRPLLSMDQLRAYVVEQQQINAKSHQTAETSAPTEAAQFAHPLLAAFENPLQTLALEQLQATTDLRPDEFYVVLAELEVAGLLVLQPDGTYKKG